MEPIKVRDWFLWFMSFVYLWAFASLYYQIPGLYGDHGILPVSSVLHCESEDLYECTLWGSKPSGLHLFVSWLGLSPQHAMEFAALLGMVVASLTIVFASMQCFTLFATLWYLYFSCFQVGQTFLWFQWDTLLIEAGFLTAMVAPLRLFRSEWLPHDNVTLFLVRWLAFRLMFASGIVKLTSECPTWWGLTALHYHFESQCIPTTLAYFAHQLADWVKKLGVAGTYLIEIFIPPLFLVPLKYVRVAAFWSQVLFMLNIMLTGNYNFFNIVYACTCLPMIIDAGKSKLSTRRLSHQIPLLYLLLKWALIGCCFGTVAFWFVYLFKVRLSFDDGFAILTDMNFTITDLYATLRWSVPLSITVGSAVFGSEVVTAIIRCLVDFRSRSTFKRVSILLQCIVVCTFATVLFAISLVPYASLDSATHSSIWPSVKRMHTKSDKFQLTHSYGLFRSMTGVGGRPEVILEGAYDVKGPWEEYEFPYKAGALDRQPPFVVPHQPRLDWQMWFAALGSYQHNPWFISLTHKILKNETDVLGLLEHNPFAGKSPPTFIRAKLYLYHFTKLRKDGGWPKNWWRRTFKNEYMVPTSKDDPAVLNYLTQQGFIFQKERPQSQPSFVLRLLSTCREFTTRTDGPKFVWAVSLAVLLAFFNKIWFLR